VGSVGVRTDTTVTSEWVRELAADLCRIPSPLGREGALAERVADELGRLGFDTELQSVVPDRPNVVAIARGDPEYQSIMFNGHLDAPGPFGSWQHDPFDPWVEDGRLYGAGIQDMKGGVASMIVGAAAAATWARPRGDIIVTVVMHHDTIGLGAKYFLEACEWRIDSAVNGEPTGLTVQTFHGGAWGWQIETYGAERHVSRLEEAADPIAAMVRIIDRLGDCLTFTPEPSRPFLPRMVVGTITAGVTNTMTASSCSATGDVRFLPGMSVDGMRADFKRVIDEVCATIPGTRGVVRSITHQWPYEIPPDTPIVRTVAAAHESIVGSAADTRDGLPAAAYITDAADLVRHGIPTAIYGPGEWNTIADESVGVADLVTAARVYEHVAVEYAGVRRES
jgi:acetylornithine deacetylase/succinyl-diaminopimelate desuccinylase-like protein